MKMTILILVMVLLLISFMWAFFLENPPKTGNFVKKYKPLINSTPIKKEWYKITNFTVESGGTVTLSSLNTT